MGVFFAPAAVTRIQFNQDLVTSNKHESFCFTIASGMKSESAMQISKLWSWNLTEMLMMTGAHDDDDDDDGDVQEEEEE